MNVSRSEGAFDGVSKNTFIFMPAANQSSEPNVIIGQVCDNVVLDANMPQNEAFELAGSFTAQKVVYDRQFEKDEMATVCLPFDIDRESAAAFGTFYTVDKVGNGFVKIDEVTTDLKAHTPYLFRAADDNQQIVMRVVQVGMPESSSAPAPRRASDVADGLYGSYGAYTTAGKQWGKHTKSATISGKVVTDGVNTATGYKADSLEMDVTIVRDNGQESFHFVGMKKTGWSADMAAYMDFCDNYLR